MTKSSTDLLDKVENGLSIERAMAEDPNLSYLEATMQWIEENSIDPVQYAKYIPQAMVDKIKHEAIENNWLRPSMKERTITNTLEDLL
ncbi:late promoter transcription accessory protein [Cronobacter phage vB_Cdu_VP8]|nr:transcription factor [Serratia phage SP1]WDS61779.1 late promoter transcription accessory protein [Cronobacter phage vB_Cdu_VP8]